MMKTRSALLLAIALIVSFHTFAQNTGRSVLFRQSQVPNGEMAINAPIHKTASTIESYHYAEWQVAADGSYKKNRGYKRGLRNRNLGIGLLAGGAASLIAGTALMADGITHIRQDRWNAYGSSLQNAGRFYETYFGAAFGAAGLAMTISGAVVLPRGKMQMKKAIERMAANP